MKKIFSIFIILFISNVSFAGNSVVMTWKDCVKEAIKSNPDLMVSAEIIKQRKSEKWMATSPILPQVTAEGSMSKSDKFSGGQNNNSNSYTVKGEQLLFDGFKTFSDIKSSKESIKASKYAYTVSSSDVRYNLRRAFAELLRAQTLVPIMEGIIVRREQNLKMIRLQYESGREHEGSLLLSKADLAQAKLDLKMAKRDISSAQYALRKALGWSSDIPITVKGDFKAEIKNVNQPNLKSIVDIHPLVEQSKAEMNSAKYDLDSSKAEFFPQLKATGEVGKMRSTNFNDEKGWSLGLNLSFPLFEGGYRIADTQKSRAKLMEKKSNLRSQYDTVLSALETAWQNFQDAKDEVEVQKMYLKAAKARAKISRAEYANGLLIFDNWIIIEDSYIQTQKKYVTVQAEMLIAEAAWIKAVGGDLSYE